MNNKNAYFLLIILTVIALFLRFYNLNWGAPFYFHPDERNIASSVSQLKFPEQMNPRFFAYGSLPIYTIYAAGVLVNFTRQLYDMRFPLEIVSIQQVSFEQAIIISRFYSALFSLLLVPLLFFIGRKLKNTYCGLMAAFLAVFSPGLIQFAHFGTFEIWLTFFTLVLFGLCLKVLESTRIIMILFLGIIFGLLVATKISHLVLLAIPILAFFFQKNQYARPVLLRALKQTTLFLLAAYMTYLLASPYVILDYPSFIGTVQYESKVALGSLYVFYTGEFANTTPIVFQFLYVYPFLLNPLLTALLIPSFLYILFISARTRNSKYLILIAFFLILFSSQAFLYVKWTRYIVPTLPFIWLIFAASFADLWRILKSHQILSIKYLLLGVFVGVNYLFATSYFITAFVQSDSRFAARNYSLLNIPSSANILSEVYDMGITPFNDNYNKITLFNFYELDNNSPEHTPSALAQQLQNSDYIILPSQRILKTRLENPEKYPNGYAFYSQLLSGRLGFHKIYETPCDLYCRITYLNNPVFSFEETANVFERPTVFIFKKN